MHNKSEEAIELNSSVNNCLLSLAQSIYNIYPHFDSNCLFTLISTVHKKYNIERLIQQLETDFIRTNVRGSIIRCINHYTLWPAAQHRYAGSGGVDHG